MTKRKLKVGSASNSAKPPAGSLNKGLSFSRSRVSEPGLYNKKTDSTMNNVLPGSIEKHLQYILLQPCGFICVYFHRHVNSQLRCPLVSPQKTPTNPTPTEPYLAWDITLLYIDWTGVAVAILCVLREKSSLVNQQIFDRIPQDSKMIKGNSKLCKPGAKVY